jgi:hypothetical protein
MRIPQIDSSKKDLREKTYDPNGGKDGIVFNISPNKTNHPNSRRRQEGVKFVGVN